MVKWALGGGKYRRKWHRTEAEAKATAKEWNEQARREGSAGVYFDAAARAEYMAAREIAERHGASVYQIAREWEATKAPEIRAAHISWPKALRDYSGEMERLNRREWTRQNAMWTLEAFARLTGAVHVADFTTDAVRAFLRTKGTASTIKTHRARLSAFGSWAARRGWLPDNPVVRIEQPTTDARQARIFTAEECLRLLAVAEGLRDGAAVRYLALGLFAFFRPGEIEHAEVLGDVVRVSHGKLRGKRAMRFVPVVPQLRAYLDAYPASPSRPERWRTLFDRIRAIAGVEWQADILRHTGISVRLAETANEAQTAREAGNSPDVIYRHYWAALSQREAAAFRAYVWPLQRLISSCSGRGKATK